MKKHRLLFWLGAALVTVALLASCEAKIDGRALLAARDAAMEAVPEGDPTVMIGFDGRVLRAKALVAELPFEPETYYWTYTAAKTDTIGLKTGETSEEKPVKLSEGSPAAGLSSSPVGPFSLGQWTFKLFAYLEAGHTTKVFEGEKTEVDVTWNSGNATEVDITVNPTTSGNGKIKVLGLVELKDNEGADDSNRNPIAAPYKRVVTITKEGSTIDPITTSVASGGTLEDAISGDLATGDYHVKVEYMDDVDSPTHIYGTGEIDVKVYPGVTTVIKGSLGENTGTVQFTATWTPSDT